MKYADTPAAPARGQNILLNAHRKTSLETFLEQLNDPLIFVLFVAAAISILLGDVLMSMVDPRISFTSKAR